MKAGTHRRNGSLAPRWLACIVLGWPGMTAANAVDTSAWSCNFCTYASGWYGALDFGIGTYSDAAARYTDYRGIDDGAFIALGGAAHYRSEPDRWFDLYAQDLGTGNRRLELRGGRRGAYTLHLAYGEVTRYRGFGARTPFLGVGSKALTLPPGWVAGDTTGGMLALASALRPLELETTRRSLQAGIDLRLSGAWRYEAEVRHLRKDGTRAFGAGVFTLQSAHFPVPVDFSENAVGMALHHTGARSALRISLDRSWFNNTNALVTWQNPFTPVGNTNFLRTSLEPDNDAWRLGVAGTLKPRSGLRLSAQASFGRSRQDDPFLPYSINPDFDGLALPRSSLGGDIEVSSLNLGARLGARLSRKLDLNLRINLDERDNRTPVDAWTPVVTDLVQRPETLNRPYSFERRQYTLDLDYRLGGATRLNTGVKRLERERSLQSVMETQQTTGWGEINLGQWERAQLRLRAEASERDITPYATVNDPGLQENPLMRKFNLAGRERRRLAVELDLLPSDRLHASLGWFRSRDHYEASVLGLLDSEEDSFSLDLGWSLGIGISAYAFASLDRFDSQIAGAVFDGAEPWRADTEDRFTTFGAGLSGQLEDHYELGLDIVSSQARGRIATDSGAGEAPFPELRNRLHTMRLRLAYRPDRPWGWTLSAERERFESFDWQIDGLPPDGLDAILTLGEQSPDTRLLLLRLQAHYRF